MSNTPFGPPLPDADETGPYALAGSARARPGMADRLEARLLSLVAPTRQEAGCLSTSIATATIATSSSSTRPGATAPH